MDDGWLGFALMPAAPGERVQKVILLRLKDLSGEKVIKIYVFPQ